jgi:hypothetical protein
MSPSRTLCSDGTVCLGGAHDGALCRIVRAVGTRQASTLYRRSTKMLGVVIVYRRVGCSHRRCRQFSIYAIALVLASPIRPAVAAAATATTTLRSPQSTTPFGQQHKSCQGHEDRPFPFCQRRRPGQDSVRSTR